MRKPYASPEFEIVQIKIYDNLLVTSGEDFVSDFEDEFSNEW